MKQDLVVSSSPHISGKNTTSKIMRDVVIALLPTTAMGIYFFRMNAFIVIMVAVISCVLSEYLWTKIVKKPNTIWDFSAVVTGLLLALNLPSTAPLWLVVIGGIFSIIIAKQLFGGLGSNIVNPVLAARAFLVVSWPVEMTNWVKPGIDAVSTATPLSILKVGGSTLDVPSIWDMFIGNIGGCIGETSGMALILGGIYLVAKKVISPAIPLTFIGTTAVIMALVGGNILFEMFAGGLMLGAIFMATDYVTSPTNFKGRIIFGIGCGIITSIIRIFGGYPEGVLFSILLMNLTVPFIERLTIPVTFGGVRKNA